MTLSASGQHGASVLQAVWMILLFKSNHFDSVEIDRGGLLKEEPDVQTAKESVK